MFLSLCYCFYLHRWLSYSQRNTFTHLLRAFRYNAVTNGCYLGTHKTTVYSNANILLSFRMYKALVLVLIMSLFIKSLPRQKQVMVSQFSSLNFDKPVCTSHLSIFATCAAHLLGLVTRIIYVFGEIHKFYFRLHGCLVKS
jgi:hypothetical protein